MIGLDTNVVVRFLTQDDAQQADAASTVMESLTETEPGYLSVVTVVEVYWVLRRAYGVSIKECASLVEDLLDARELRVGHEATIRTALTSHREGLDFADAVIAALGQEAGCERTVTFDQAAARSGAMQLLPY